MRIAALVATRPRPHSLCEMSLPSIARQTRKPDLVVIVCDSRDMTVDEVEACKHRVPDCELIVLRNQGLPGVAGTWNTGLKALESVKTISHVALLDDDDSWDPCHLACCEETALTIPDSADVVISGLRLVKDGHELPRLPLTSLSITEFLIGNPGWQGSNTFASVRLMKRVGGFTEGLRSANDRDLAIRVLDLPDVTIAFTNRMTATWHLNSASNAITRFGGEDKRLGLQRFHRLHGHRMSDEVAQMARARALTLFGVEIDLS